MCLDTKKHLIEIIDKLLDLDSSIDEDFLKQCYFVELDYAIARLELDISEYTNSAMYSEYDRSKSAKYFAEDSYLEKANRRLAVLRDRAAWIYDP